MNRELFIQFLNDAEKLPSDEGAKHACYVNPDLTESETKSIEVIGGAAGIELFFDLIIYWWDGNQVPRETWLEKIEELS